MRSSALNRALATLPGLPLVTVMGLLLCALGVSLISTYDSELRWLRFGSVLFAVGLAMWLPAVWAAPAAAATSLLSGLVRGGAGDAGLFRTETLLEGLGLAATAVLAAWLREQITCLIEGSGRQAAPVDTDAGQLVFADAIQTESSNLATASVNYQANTLELTLFAPTELDEPQTCRDPMPSLLTFHQDESLASYGTYLACLRLELAKTASMIQELKLGSELDIENGREAENSVGARGF